MIDKLFSLFNLLFAAFLVNEKMYGWAVIGFGAFIISIANWIVSEIKESKRQR